jgi:hypothetical protein
MPQALTWKIRVSLLVWAVIFDPSTMGGLTTSYDTASIALQII